MATKRKRNSQPVAIDNPEEPAILSAPQDQDIKISEEIAITLCQILRLNCIAQKPGEWTVISNIFSLLYAKLSDESKKIANPPAQNQSS